MPTLDSRKAPHVLTSVPVVIVGVLGGRLLFSDERMVRLAGVVVVIVAGSLLLIGCWRLLRSKSR